jgi:hypothetical protein
MTMAATPKRSLKRTVASTVEERSPRFLLGSLALAMVISLLAGLGIGIKVGEHNKTNKANSAAVKPKPTPTSRPGAGAKGARPTLKGTVVRKLPKVLVISTGKARIQLIMLPKTRFEVTAPATASDIKVGTRVLFVLKPNAAGPGTTKGTATGTGATGATASFLLAAKSVLIVTGTKARLGSLVSSVTANAMTFKLPNGKSLAISTAGAKVSKTIPSTQAKLVSGQHVLVKWVPFTLPAKPTKGKKKKAAVPARKLQRIAIEIVAVSASSAFA